MNKICWRDFYSGFITGAAIVLLVLVCILPGLLEKKSSTITPAESAMQPTDTTDTPEEEEADLKMYNTSIQDWSVSVEDGTELKFKTPTDWYSLADQYQDGLVEYYGKELPDTGIVCVGDSTDQYSATMIINARPLSDVKEVLQVIYGDDLDEEILYSDTYMFMTEGTEPENSTIEELDSIEANGHTYRVFKHGFDTEYYTDEEQTETTSVHTDELVSYSDTEDKVEIIMYMSEFDQEKGVAALREFLGAEE